MTYKCPYCGLELKFDEVKNKLSTYRKCSGYIAGERNWNQHTGEYYDKKGCGKIFRISRTDAPKLILTKIYEEETDVQQIES